MPRSSKDNEKLQQFWLQIFTDSQSRQPPGRTAKPQTETSGLPADAYLQFRMQRRTADAADGRDKEACPAYQSVESRITSGRDLQTSRQIEESMSRTQAEGELWWRTDELSLSHHRAVVVEWDAGDEKYSWLAAPTAGPEAAGVQEAGKSQSINCFPTSS